MSRYRSFENNGDYLFIKKEDKILTQEELSEGLWVYNGNLDFSFNGECIFNNEEFRIINNFRSKILYALSCYYNDDEVIATVRELRPDIVNIELPFERHSKSGMLKEWMQKYNFTLKDFFTNDKYVVVSSVPDEFRLLIDLGLIDWENFEHYYCEGEYSEEEE